MNIGEIIEKAGKVIFYLIFIIVLGILTVFILMFIYGNFLCYSSGGYSKDARIQVDMSQIRSVAEVIGGENTVDTKELPNYSGLSCDSTWVKPLCDDIGKHSGFNPVFFLSEKKDMYCTVAQLNNGRHWCVDSVGHSQPGSCADKNFTCSQDAPIPSFYPFDQSILNRNVILKQTIGYGLIILIFLIDAIILVRVFKKKRFIIIAFFVFLVCFIAIALVSLSGARKPAIYLYPEEDSFVNIKLKVRGMITKDIPEYNDGWNVFVTKEGLIDKKYDYLFYEALLFKVKLSESGWVVKYENLNQWFKDNLEKLGLNEKEKNQFIEYWLKELPGANYYEIRLVDKKFLDENMALNISPKPDTEIRLLFSFKPLQKEVTLEEPEIVIPKRNGFTVVEWGGILER